MIKWLRGAGAALVGFFPLLVNVEVKLQLLPGARARAGRQMAAWTPALSGRKCGRKSHDYSN